MLAHRVFAPIKRVLPSRISGPIRSLVTGVLTPAYFSYESGHFRSSLRARAVDRAGRPLPWYTYPMIDFLDAKDLSRLTVLEFGAGQSTLWWAARARRVVALEADAGWHAEISRALPGNAVLHHVPHDLSDLDARIGSERFDLVVVDGFDRHQAACRARDLLAEGGAVILDDSEGHWGDNGGYPIIDLFREAGFLRVDFYGHAPGVVLPRCTSIFLKADSAFLRGEESPVRRYEYPAARAAG